MFVTVTLPLFLTLVRLFGALFIVPLLILLPWQTDIVSAGFFFCVLFILNLTDFFDGFFARRFGQESRLGALLDPLADKLLMLVLFSGLFSVRLLGFFPFVVMMAREFVVLSLREGARSYGFVVPVDCWGKYKTASQMVMCLWALMLHVLLGPLLGRGAYALYTGLIVCSVTLSIVSGIRYGMQFVGALRAYKE